MIHRWVMMPSLSRVMGGGVGVCLAPLGRGYGTWCKAGSFQYLRVFMCLKGWYMFMCLGGTWAPEGVDVILLPLIASLLPRASSRLAS
jgi:hypothetical protein